MMISSVKFSRQAFLGAAALLLLSVATSAHADAPAELDVTAKLVEIPSKDARQAYLRAAELFPQLSDASLGATLQVLGELDEAAASYQLARSVNPNLPGVDRNVAILEDERRAAE